MSSTAKQKAARRKVFTDHKSLISELNCAHYCAVGGHFWYHSPPVGFKGLPQCEFRSSTTEMIQCFKPCPRHRHTLQPKKKRFERYREEWD